jgi:hypothetical protein
MACFEYINPGVWYVFAIAFRLAGIEREIVLSPNNQQLWLRLL